MNQPRSGLRRVLAVVDRISFWTAKVSSWLIIIMVIILMREVIGRYFFGAPTNWANEFNENLLCWLTMLGGAYCVSTDSHIRVDIVWWSMTMHRRAAVELITAAVPLGFMGVVIWLGSLETWEALLQDKRSMSVLALPQWPSLLAVTLGTVLMLIQWLARMIRNVIQLHTGENEHPPILDLVD
ncbi:MAG: TRAP transporter small permease [Pseudomonadota bacterium]